MRVFVTGGTGLVGSHAIERLTAQGHRVRAMVRSAAGATLVTSLGADAAFGTAEDENSWEAARGADAIVHAAALVTKRASWKDYWQSNVESTRFAVETAASINARLVHISSVAVYGRQVASHLITEDCAPAPIAETDFYARSKRDAEQVLWRRAEQLGVSAVAIRPCVIYGERERLFMSRLIGVLRYGVAPIVGTGQNELAVVYVGNVIDTVIAALERREVSGPFNTANDGGLTQQEFYEIIGDALGRTLHFVRIPQTVAVIAGASWHTIARVLRPDRYVGVGSWSGRFLARDNPYSSERAEEELDWRPSTPPREALRRTARWFVDQFDSPMP